MRLHGAFRFLKNNDIAVCIMILFRPEMTAAGRAHYPIDDVV